MRRSDCRLLPGVLLLLAAPLGPLPAAGQAAATTVLSRYDFEGGDPPQLRLARSLEEISGLAFDSRGRLYAHQDESADVFELDPASGDIRARFRAGTVALAGDFEGIASVGSKLFLVDSDGLLLEYRRGEDGSLVSFRGVATNLGKRCEVEGLTYDELHEELLLACKTARTPDLEDRIAVFAFSLERMSLDTLPRLLVPMRELEALDLPNRFAPSALDVDPITGHLLVASAAGSALLEIDRDGRPVAGRRLPGSRFPQIEGLAFDRRGDLYVASEGAGGRARLTRFPIVPPGESSP